MWKVFYSYPHEDAFLRQRLGTYLAPLRQQKKIEEWYDRQIKPGANWDNEVSAQLESAHLILLLVSADFLASDYIFGVEIDRALARLKRGEVKVVPILLSPCLWQDSRLSELQIIPRDAKPVTSALSVEQALTDVAIEIRELIAGSPPVSIVSSGNEAGHRFDASLRLVRDQVQSYARLYERTRQRMRASDERTKRMEEILAQMRALAPASYPLLDELANSPSPGERLAAVAVLQVFATEKFLPFLVQLVGSEKPFVGYHAIKALHFAVGALDPRVYTILADTLRDAETALNLATPGFDTGRHKLLRGAKEELANTIDALSASTPLS